MLGAIANTFANCFKIPELKSRIIFTVLLLGMYSLFTGGAMQHCAVGSLGIMPYITATIIVQLLTAVVPQLSKLAREEGGRAKLIQIGRCLTVVLCLGHGTLMTLGWENPTKIFPQFTGQLVLIQNLWWYRIQTILILATGTLLLMWLGEQISERGIGNGISLVISIGIMARLPQAGQALMDLFHPANASEGRFNLFYGVAMVCLLFGVIAGVIAVTQAQRKVAVQYAQRAIGRKVVAGGTSFMPLRVNYAGVMPIIFAQAILMFPAKIFQFLGSTYGSLSFLKNFANYNLREGDPFYLTLYGLMILFFSYF